MPVQPAAPQLASAPAELPWLGRLADGIDEGQRKRQPILVDVGAEWCGWCHQLDEQIVLPQVQAKLAGWARVKLDADRDTEAARQLSVGPIPALRLLSPQGRVIASHDGYMSGADLTGWLDAHYKQAASLPGDALGDEPADAPGVQALLAKLADPDVVVREAITRRLLRRPDLAAGPVVDVFASGKLSARLSALELLQEWHAPIEGLDPWDPPTISTEKIGALRQWAAGVKRPAPATVPSTKPGDAPRAAGETAPALSADRLADARRDIAAMLGASTGPEGLAARERLARFGPALLGEVYASLKSAGTDQERERLTALRYRLVTSDALALGWPGGLERLASSEPAVRHAALDELGTKVTPADAPLLAELFSDADPLMREGSLRLLQAAGAEPQGGAISGLARLLHDPEPNVRAAVLKQLAETPMPGMDEQVVRFVATEKDPDLLVHAVRVLREAKTPGAINCLLSLLAHPSWRVRAEAAEALGKAVANSSDEAARARAADVYAAMVRLLDDADGFVVGRALLVLRDGGVETAMEPMYNAAQKRPELAADVVKALTRGAREHPGAVGYLRKFCAHAVPSVRAAAITGLCEALPKGASPEVLTALSDPVPEVRVTAAAGLFSVLESFRPNPEEEVGGGLFGFGKKHKPDMEVWLEDFRADRRQPQWGAAMVPPLQKMLDSGTSDERLAAAPSLVALGHDGKALAVVHEALNGPIGDRQRAIDVLPWLPWDARLALFDDLAANAGHAELGRLVERIVVIPNVKAATPLWGLAAKPQADVSLAHSVQTALSQLYTGQRYFSSGQADSEKVKLMSATATEKAASGTEMQRLIALSLLLEADPSSAAMAAIKIAADNTAPLPLRRDAFQVQLLGMPVEESRKLAVAALAATGGDPDSRKLAVKFLARGTAAINELRDNIYVNTVYSTDVMAGPDTPPILAGPPGLTAPMLKPLLDDADKESAACAGYLLALLGDRAGLNTLVAYWRQNLQRGGEWEKLTYRAVAAQNDDTLTPILEEIYKSMGDQARWYGRDLYWTLQKSKGPNVEKLRAKMMKEIGKEYLQ